MVGVFVVSVATSLIAAGVGYVVDMRGGSFVQMLLGMVVVFAVSFVNFVPKYRSALRGAGYTIDDFSKMTKRRWLATSGTALAIVVAIALCDLAYARSGNRLAEAVVAATAALPISWLLAKIYEAMPSVKHKDAEIWRWNYIFEIVTPIVFGVNLILQLVAHHRDPELEPFRNLEIAMCFVLLSLNPVVVVLMKRRYLEASGAPQP